jgi:hypothetical protein
VDKVADVKVLYSSLPIAVAARSEALVCGRSLAGDCGFHSRRRNVNAVCCDVNVSVTADCSSRGVRPNVVYLQYDLEAATIGRA